MDRHALILNYEIEVIFFFLILELKKSLKMKIILKIFKKFIKLILFNLNHFFTLIHIYNNQDIKEKYY